MKYLAPYALLLCVSVANAEIGSTNPSEASATLNHTEKVKQTTEAVAKRLINILGLTSIPKPDQASMSLKEVVIGALGEGKQMSEIRRATNQAVKEVTGKALPASTVSVSRSSLTAAQVSVTKSPSATIAANPSEVSLDPETGKMMATLLPGESIYRLAQRVYGKKNGRMYLEIHAANRDKIKNINIVAEGLVLTMP